MEPEREALGIGIDEGGGVKLLVVLFNAPPKGCQDPDPLDVAVRGAPNTKGFANGLRFLIVPDPVPVDKVDWCRLA